MFTGIITNTAKVERIGRKSKVEGRRSRGLSLEGGRLFVRPKTKFSKIKIGESIAVNGCCLTVVSYKNNVLEFDVSDETMRKTALSNFQKGTRVNLERAMMAADRFGGHFVLGHVDGVGKVTSIKCHPGSVEYKISYPKKFSKLLIEKGSVTVDGISLTVCDLKNSSFNLYIIPHTIKETHLADFKKGDAVNLEFDVLGKYVAQMVPVKKSR